MKILRIRTNSKTQTEIKLREHSLKILRTTCDYSQYKTNNKQRTKGFYENRDRDVWQVISQRARQTINTSERTASYLHAVSRVMSIQTLGKTKIMWKPYQMYLTSSGVKPLITTMCYIDFLLFYVCIFYLSKWWMA